MGEIASRLSDQVLITSDNPRNEDPDSIINEIYHGVPSVLKEKVFTVTDRWKP